jgi:hypothetical protein
LNTLTVLKRSEIDEVKWNRLIQHSTHSLPYAFSWYLDVVAENWDALVWGNYEAAMPLVWLRKYGIKCLYQPYYCQQLGIFSSLKLTPQVMKQFLEHAAKEFPYIGINLQPEAAAVADQFNFKEKKNLLLSLNKEYPRIQKEYSANHRRNIAKAHKAGLKFSEEVQLKPFQKFYLENVNREAEGFELKHEKNFRKLSQVVLSGGMGKIFAAVNEEEKIFSAVMMVLNQSRIINITSSTSAEGRQHGASHFLFDGIIQKFAGTDIVLDFEGSSVPSIARFYEGFGAEPEIFYSYKNTLLKNLRQRFF